MLLKTKKQIIEWLENYGVKNYKLIPDEKIWLFSECKWSCLFIS